MRKIICVTLNPAIDKTIFVDNLEIGYVNRANEVHYEIGGKGINVAKVLSNFGVKSIVTGFAGGMWSDMLRTKLMRSGIETKFFKLIQDTRINTKIIQRETAICTAVNECGPPIPTELLERFMQSFRVMCHEDDVVVLSGCIPPGVSTDIYYHLITIAKEKGAKTIVDIKGEALHYALGAGPDVIKLNYRDYIPKESWQHFSKEMIEMIYSGVEKALLLHPGRPTVLISLGKNGALLLKEEDHYYAESIDVGVDLKYTVGASDAMVAALIMGTLEEFEAPDLLRYAVACGAANVMARDTSGCTPMHVNELVSDVHPIKFI